MGQRQTARERILRHALRRFKAGNRRTWAIRKIVLLKLREVRT